MTSNAPIHLLTVGLPYIPITKLVPPYYGYGGMPPYLPGMYDTVHNFFRPERERTPGCISHNNFVLHLMLVAGISRKNTTTTAGAMTPPLVQVLNCILKFVFYLLLPFLLGQLSSSVEEYVFVMKAISKFVFYLLQPLSLDNCHLWWKNVSSS
jgi:hypothetical protein